jgi:hypothetical protein
MEDVELKIEELARWLLLLLLLLRIVTSNIIIMNAAIMMRCGTHFIFVF